MKLSIITITYNNYDELLDTCKSLENISIPFEHIVINGGDCEMTLEFLSKINTTDQVTVISEPDKGIYDAFNKGVNCARAEYISFLNSGDLLIDPSYHEDGIKEIVSGNLDFVHSGNLFDDQKYGKYKLHPKKGNNPGKGMLYMHPSMVVKRELFDQVGGFNLSYKIAGDFDWACRVWKKNYHNRFLQRYPISMNNRGISSQNEKFAIKECQYSLCENGLFSGATKIYFYNRLLKYKLRNMLSYLDLFKIGKLYKKFLTH